MKDIGINAYVIKVAPLWEANTNTQFILDPYAATRYCTSNLTRNDKYITIEFEPSLNNVKIKILMQI
jgi:hypothetical protein